MTRSLTHSRSILRTRQRGVAMVLVLIALAMATVIGLSFLNTQSTTTGIAQNVGKQTRARGIAESALEMTIDHLRTNPNWRSDKTSGTWIGDESANNQLDGGKFTIIVQDGIIDDNGDVVGDGDLSNNMTDKVVITAVGYYQGVSHSIRAQITPTAIGPQYKVLYILSDSTPYADEWTRIEMLQSLGYIVDTVSRYDSQSTFDTKIAASDVIYISARADQVASKVVNAGIGIVTEEIDTFSVLGFSTNYSTFTDNSINLTNNSHDITSSLSTGDLVITTSNQPLSRLYGTVGSGVTTLALQPGSNYVAFATLSKGVTMSTGASTAGRRVALPWGPYNFDVTSINDTGKKLLKASLDWAAQTPTEGGGIWAGKDIGYTSPVGSNTYNSGVYTIKGSGDDIWDYDDAFRFVYMPVTGDGELVARVTSVYNTDSWAKAGVMIRESLDDDSRHAMVVVTPASGIAYQHRLSTGGLSLHDGKSGSAPYWVKIVRSGNNIRGYVSSSGSSGTWTAAGDTIAFTNLPNTMYFGMCVTSHNTISLCTAKFDNVTLTGTTPVEEEESDAKPQLIVKYEFNEVTPPAPVLVHRWKLDETTGPMPDYTVYGIGASANDEFHIKEGTIDSYTSALGNYSTTKSSKANVTLNTLVSDKFRIDDYPTVKGNLYVGVGAVPENIVKYSNASAANITGSILNLTQNVDLPTTIDLPSNLPYHQGNVKYDNYWYPSTIYSNMYTDDFEVTDGATLYISGDITLVVKNFKVKKYARVIIKPGSSLVVYARDNVEINENGALNANGYTDTSGQGAENCAVYCLNGKDIVVDNSAIAVGYLYATHDLKIHHSGKIFGAAAAGNKFDIHETSDLHVDLSLVGSATGEVTNVAADENGVSDGVFKNGPTGPYAGPVGTAVHFDGDNDYVQIAHDDNMLLDSGTVAMWIKADNLTGKQAFFSKDSSGYGNGGYLAMWIENSKIKASLRSTTTQYPIESSTITSGQWYHVTFSWGEGGMKLFVNGQLVSSNTNYTGGLGTSSGGTGNKTPIILGARTTTSYYCNEYITSQCDYFTGYIDDVRMYDKGFEQPQALQLYNGGEPGDGTASYLVEDTSNFGTPLNLYVQNTNNVNWIDGGGLEFTSATSAVSYSAATKIHTALTATNRMTLEAKFITSNITQNGPANIVSYSQDNYARNFTFGQSDQKYLMRLRTSLTSDNGATPVYSGNVLATDVMQHVVVTYDGQQVKLYRNGSTTPEVTTNFQGTFNWNSAYRLILGNEEGDTNPWLGKLYRFTIYDQALNQLQVKDLFDGNPPGDYQDQGNLTFHVRWYENP